MPDIERGAALVAEATESLTAARSDQLLGLARAVSLAVLVEPALLRRARLVMVPGADAGVESDVWFSPLVHTRNRTGIVLHPDALEAIRSELPIEEARRVRRVVEQSHERHAPALRLEEDLVWQAVRHRAGEVGLESVEERVRQAIKGMVEHDDGGRSVARWAGQAWSRLPGVVAGTDSARLLAVGTALRIRGAAPVALEEALPSSLAWLAPPDLPVEEVGIEVVAGGVRFVEPEPDGLVLELPRTSPLTVELTWQAGSSPRTIVTPLRLGERIALDGLAGPVTVRTLTGRRYVIEPEFAPGTGTEAARPAIEPADEQPRPPPDFFIRSAPADRAWAEWIAFQLDAAGYRTFLPKGPDHRTDEKPAAAAMADMDAAAAAMADMDAAAADMDAAADAEQELVVLSESASGAAELRQLIAEPRRLLPVRVGQVAARGLPRELVYVDLVDMAEHEARRELLRGARRSSERRPLPPAAPPGPPPPFPGSPPRRSHMPR